MTSAFEQPVKWFWPGQSVRFRVKANVLKVLTDAPNTLTLTLRGRDGKTIVDTAPVHDSTGYYHSDQVIPVNAAPGKWVARWQSTGSQAAQNAMVERPFGVRQLDF